jgi:ATP-dependent Zn protease
MFIGDGAKLVWDAFQLVKEKVPCIIFIDRLMQLEQSGLIGILLGLLVCHLGLRTFA